MTELTEMTKEYVEHPVNSYNFLTSTVNHRPLLGLIRPDLLSICGAEPPKNNSGSARYRTLDKRIQ